MRRLNKKYWPHMVKTNFIDDKVHEAHAWCKNNLTGNNRWTLTDSNRWYFTKEKDVTMFLLAFPS